MKNIGLIIPTLCFGGAERVISKLSTILDEMGYNVYLVVFSSKDIAFDYKGTLIDINVEAKDSIINKIGNVIKRSIKLSKIKRKYKLDMTISFLRAADLINYISWGNCKKVYSIRGFEDYTKNRHFYNFILKNKNCKIIVQTYRLKKFIEEQNNKQFYEKIMVLGNPFDVKKISELSNKPIDEELKVLLEGHRLICTIGSFKKAKNHWNLLKSFNILKQYERFNDVRLVMVGDNGELECKIKAMANKSKYVDDIIFTGVKHEPFNIISNSTVFVLPSLSEGIPNTLAEAMACSIPVIATDCKTGPRELLYENPDIDASTYGIEYADYGILIKEFSENVDFDYENLSKSNYFLTNAIIKVLDNTKLQKEYGEKSFEGIKRLDIENYKISLLKIIESI